MTRQQIEESLDRHGYRIVSSAEAETDAVSGSSLADARSPSIEILQRRYDEPRRRRNTANITLSVDSPDGEDPASSLPGGAIVRAEPRQGNGKSKVVVLSEDGEILGEAG